MRFVTIPSLVQVAMTSALLIALGWATVTSIYFFLRDGELKARDMKLAEVSADYQNLSTDFSALERDIEARTALLEQRQKLLESLLGRTPISQAVADVAEKRDDEQATPAASDDQTAPPTTETGKPPANNDDTTKGGTLSDASSANPAAADSPKASAVPVTLAAADQPDILKLAEDRAAIKYANNVLARGEALDPTTRRRELLERLRRLEAQQRRLTKAMQDVTMASITNIDDVLDPVSLTSETLIAQSDRDGTYGTGGPFIPLWARGEIEPVFASSDARPLEKLLSTLADHDTLLAMLSRAPFGEPAENYYLSSKFGRRRDPLKKTWSSHPGIDLAGWPGNAILATADGKVVHASWYGPYGRMIEIDHGNGFKTRFGHMRKLLVKKGDLVKAGQQIGEMGKSGRVTGPHLHYEVWLNGKLQDPLPYVREAKNVFKVQEQLKVDASIDLPAVRQ